MRRLLSLLLALCCLLPALAHADDAKNLRSADTVEEVASFLLEPTGGVLPEPQAGMIRYMTINSKDKSFLTSCWKSDSYNLMVKTDAAGNTYKIDNSHMHSRAVYCMAMSYLGYDVTPVMMSEIAGSRDLTEPYDLVTRRLGGVERVEYYSDSFDTMVRNYLTDSRYSPVFCQIRLPNGPLHTVLIVAKIPSTGGFIICDPAAIWQNGSAHHCYKMAWHVMREVVLSSAFYDTFYGSEVVALYQWKLTDK